MEPFFFESGNGNLFGVYHPSADPMSRKSVVICPPIYQEYFRTYRLLSRLAERWAAKGYHVLRFDYFGTGDSAGEASEGGPEIWCNDIRSAISELSEISGSDRVSILGVRLGATMALKAMSGLQAVESAIVWDPIFVGGDYIKDLRIAHGDFVDSLVSLTGRERKMARSELAGFESYPWREEEIQKLRLAATDLTGIEHLSVVSSHEECPELADFLDQCLSNGINIESKRIEADCSWYSASGAQMHVPGLVEGVESCLK